MEFIKNMPPELVVLIVAMLPIFELRGSIPLGLAMGLPLFKVIGISLIGNIVIVIPIYFFLKPISNSLRRFVLWRRFFDWLFERAMKKSAIIQRYEALGLAVFVGIPLPMTGAWTGCIVASLLNLKFKYAFIAIVAGVIMAAIIVSLVCVAGTGIIKQIFTTSIKI